MIKRDKMVLKNTYALPEEKCFIESMFSIGTQMGAKAPLAKILSTLTSQPDEMSLDDLATRTGYSLATVSNILKELEFMHWAQRTKKPGDKKVYVVVEKNSLTMFQQQIRTMMRMKFTPMKRDIPPLVASLKEKLKKESNKEKKENIKKKIALYQNYLDQALWFEDHFNHMNEILEKEKKQFDL